MALGGLEMIHTWNSGVVLNDHDVFPRWKVHAIRGLHGLGDMDDFRDNAIGRPGEIVQPSFPRGNTVVYEGELQARTLASLNAARDGGRNAFVSRREGQMLLTYHGDYGGDSGAFFFEGRAVQFTVDDELIAGPNAGPVTHKRRFTIGIRLSDPRVYQLPQVSGTTAAITGTSAGVMLPTTGVPPYVTPLPFTIATTVVGGGLTIYNPGGRDTDPVVTIWGPVINPRFTSLTLDKKIQFKDNYALASDEWVVVDFKRRTILHEGVADVRNKLDVGASDWWDPGQEGETGVIGGFNSFLLGGDTIGDPAHAKVEFFPAV